MIRRGEIWWADFGEPRGDNNSGRNDGAGKPRILADAAPATRLPNAGAKARRAAESAPHERAIGGWRWFGLVEWWGG